MMALSGALVSQTAAGARLICLRPTCPTVSVKQYLSMELDYHSVMFERLVGWARGFLSNLRDILASPRGLVLNILWLCALLYTFTDQKLQIFVPVLLALWVIGYMIYLDKREGYKPQLLRRLGVVVFCSLAISTSFYGYFYMKVNDIQTASFPTDVLNKTGYVRDRSLDSSQLLMYGLLRVETRAFRYDDRDLASPPYPGVVFLVTLKTVIIPPQDMIRDEVMKRIEGLKMDGLTIQKETRKEGTGVIRSGHETNWVEYDALLQVPGSGSLIDFPVGARIKVRAEWWPCPERGTVVIVAGAAMYGTSPSGNRIRDIVLPPGPDDMATYDSIVRLIYNTKCTGGS